MVFPGVAYTAYSYIYRDIFYGMEDMQHIYEHISFWIYFVHHPALVTWAVCHEELLYHLPVGLVAFLFAGRKWPRFSMAIFISFTILLSGITFGYMFGGLYHIPHEGVMGLLLA